MELDADLGIADRAEKVALIILIGHGVEHELEGAGEPQGQGDIEGMIDGELFPLADARADRNRRGDFFEVEAVEAVDIELTGRYRIGIHGAELAFAAAQRDLRPPLRGGEQADQNDREENNAFQRLHGHDRSLLLKQPVQLMPLSMFRGGSRMPCGSVRAVPSTVAAMAQWCRNCAARAFPCGGGETTPVRAGSGWRRAVPRDSRVPHLWSGCGGAFCPGWRR